jgi:cytochrome c biogenesis protein CcmG/thiol:disulfide interchange protein DsbE
MKRIFLWIGLGVFLLILGLGLLRAQKGQVEIGQPAPDFTLTTFEGEEYHLADLRGNIIVLNFWASWCESCKPEARDLEEAWRTYQDRGDVLFLGVDYVDTEPDARAYLEQFDITYPNGPDRRTKISQAFRIKGVPETYIIDREGVIHHVQIGPFRSYEHIVSYLEPLLNQ